MERNLDPCIIFSFSKKECEAYAAELKNLDFNDDAEKDLVEQVFENGINALSDDDKRLPQVEAILPLLKRGIGIHHGGLLPILKEIIEILFSEGLIKCLFATETFAIGINMPAKTVVFTNFRKFDGKDFRWLSAGEYIQMSGRAGRRGKDDKGVVIQMLDEKMEPAVSKAILYGASDPLISAYHVSYNMLLNMMRVEGADPEFLLRSSFYQYQQEQAAPALELEATELEREKDAIAIPNENQVAEYYSLCKQLERTKTELNAIMLRPQYCVPFMQIGRLVHVAAGSDQWGWGAVVNLRRTDGKGTGGSVNL
jgi:ATP-dependent RNA helicase DOB1